MPLLAAAPAAAAAGAGGAAAGGLSALGTTLLSGALSAAAGGIGAAIKAKAANKDRQQEKELATIDRTKPGFNDFGDDLIEKFGHGRFDLKNAGKGVLFPKEGLPGARRF